MGKISFGNIIIYDDTNIAPPAPTEGGVIPVAISEYEMLTIAPESVILQGYSLNSIDPSLTLLAGYSTVAITLTRYEGL